MSDDEETLIEEARSYVHPDSAHALYLIGALADALESANALLAARDQALDEIKALHKNWYEVGGVRHEMRVYSAEPPAGHVCLNPGDSPYGDVCDAEDGEHYVLACVECTAATDDGEPGYRLWPCATERVLTRLDTQGETK
jgi:hypothetical protein